jgi:hypothetical protein
VHSTASLADSEPVLHLPNISGLTRFSWMQEKSEFSACSTPAFKLLLARFPGG